MPHSDSRLFSFYLSAMHDLGRALMSEPRRVQGARPLRESLYRILGTFAVSRGALLTMTEDESRIEVVASKGLRNAAALETRFVNPRLKKLAGLSRPFRPGLPPGGLEPIAASLAPKLEKLEVTWIVPLATGASFVGLLVLGERLDRRPLTEFELSVLEEMAGLLALRIDDARIRRRMADQVRELQKTQRQLRQIFLETVRALAGVIDPPEPQGGPTHSARVASLSAEMARRLGLGGEACERLYVAGLLHDVGKQAINQEILAKGSSLTMDERKQIERHPAAASELIGHIRFPWGDVAEIIRHHHERLDGMGYPDRLCGDQISIEARVLMMAEAFDSMASDQPWRRRLEMPKIVEQIGRNLGLQFEPRVVRALCEAVECGLVADGEPPEFMPNLSAGFDPAIIRKMLKELRRQIAEPSMRPPARILEAIATPQAI